MKKSILAILLAVVMVASLLPMAALAEEPEFQDWTSNSSLPTTSGYYKLTTDVTVSAETTIGGYAQTVPDKPATSIVLDLNGHTITAENNKVFYIQITGSLTITDSSSEASGKITNSSSSSKSGALISVSGYFALDGGTVENTNGGYGLSINGNAKAYINNGIIKNTARNGYAVFHNSAQTLTMTGGTIINTAEGSYALYLNKGRFEMSGGKISTDCSYSSYAAVYANNGNGTPEIYISGGEIESKTVGIYAASAQINITGLQLTSDSYAFQTRSLNIDAESDDDVIVNCESAIVYQFRGSENNINGGTYDASTLVVAYTTEDPSKLSIDGGIFNLDPGAVTKPNNTTISIKSGSFPDANITDYLPEGLTQDDKGNVVIDTEDEKVVASIGSTIYNNFHDAVAAAQSGETVKLWKNTTVDSWEQIWNLSGVTIDGQEHELTVGAVTSNGNGNYLVYDAENLNVKDLTIKFTTNGNGFTLDSGKFDNVDMYAGMSSSYAIFVGTSNKEDAKVEINACYFEGFDAAVYSQPGNGTTGVTSDISITNSIFDECDLTVCSYAAETVFNGNTVRDCGSNSFAGGVDKGNTNVTYEIKNNTFEDGGKIWFYDGNLDNVVFEKNSVQGNTYLTTDDSNGGTLDVSNNYWGGDAPSEKQIQGEGNVTGKDKYYLEPTMDDDDISVFYDVYYVYNNGVGMGYERVLKGESVTLTTPSKSGYAFLGWACTDGKVYDGGDKVAIWGNTTFEASWVRHPDTPYVPEPEQPEQPETPTFPFYDVSSSAWYYSAVKYVYENKLMDGVDTYVFAPNDTLTRAMVWTIIARMSGVDTTGGNTWYAKAQEWVITNGISDGENPTAAITREQLVTMLYRYAQIKGYDVSVGENTNILSYVDATSISEYAMSAFQWACGSGLTEGDENGALTPLATATRAQAAAMIMRFCQSVK